MADNNPAAWDSLRAGSVQRYLHGEETLRVTAFNAASGVRLRISGRRLDRAGGMSTFSDQLTPTTNRAATTFDKPMVEGWLLSVAVRIDAGSPADGQCYVLLELGLGSGNQFVPLDVLASDTISATRRVAWPGSALRGPLDGAGTVRTISGSTPAAAAEVSETVPTGARWELIAFRATFVTSAVVANRLPRLQLDDGLTTFWNSPVNINHAASITIGYQFAAGLGQSFSDSITNEFQALPANLRMLGTWRIRTLTGSISAGDQWSAIVYIVREWIEGA
ncbi:MAG: hypothetical protein LC750_16725 [Actinobacteria bacterium]|nr:hypothetical protein [Actinomycetota bacterium]